MKSIAIIPTRSGSKGLPDKNIRPLAGKPLLAYSVEAALKSRYFDVIHVSTDSEKYAQLAREYGADVPFLRSAEASSDTASSWDAVREVLGAYSLLGKDFDAFMLLQPTSPLRTPEDIAEAFELMKRKGANSIVSVCKADHSPKEYGILPEDGSLTAFIADGCKDSPRQKSAAYYRINGAIYLAKTSFFLEIGDIYSDKCYALLMDKERSVDIDDLLDFKFAETIVLSSGELKA